MYEALTTLLRWLVVLGHLTMRQCAKAVFLALPGAWQQVEGVLPPEQMAAFSVVICLWAVGGAAYSKRMAISAKPGKAIRLSASAVLRVLSWLSRHLGR
jgi:hypothetical protein